MLLLVVPALQLLSMGEDENGKEPDAVNPVPEPVF
jgi:hypothetical protein